MIRTDDRPLSRHATARLSPEISAVVAGAGLAALYLHPPLWGAAALLAVVVAASAACPAGPVIILPATMGLIEKPIGFGSQVFNPAEVLLAATLAGVALRAAAILARQRTAVVRPFIARARGVALRGFGPVALALLTVGTLSLVTVADPAHRHESIREYRWVIVEPVLYAGLVCWYLTSPRRRWLAGASFLAGATAVSAYGIASFLEGSGLAVEGVVRLSATFPHPNALALYLERPLLFGFAMAVAFRGRLSWAWLAPTALIALVFVLTFSRGALIGAGVAAIGVAVLGRQRRMALALVAGSAAAGLVLAAIAGPRLMSLFQGGSGSLRISIWRSSLAMIRDHPVFGVGLDQFLYQYAPRYVSPEAWPERFTSHPHNLVLDIWLRLGIMGLVVAAVYAVILIRRARFVVASRSRVGLGALGAIAAGVLHGLVDNGYFLPGVALAFWFLTALIEMESGLDAEMAQGRRQN